MDYDLCTDYIPSVITQTGSFDCGLENDPTQYEFTYSAEGPSDLLSKGTYIDRHIDSHCVSGDKSDQSFALIRKSGVIKMTNYSVTTNETLNYLAKIPKSSAKLGWPHRSDWCDCGTPVHSIARWNRNYTLDELLSIGKEVYPITELESMGAAINKAQAQVVSESYQALDALTTLSEIGDSLQLLKDTLLTVRHPLRSFGKLRQKLMRNNKLSYKKLNHLLTESWLQYRYAIMPEILTVCDTVSLLEKRGYMFQTNRSLQNVPFNPVSLPSSLPDRYITKSQMGSVVIRATGKARFGSQPQKMFDQISFNPVQTAWELIPYSFIVDWFVNVGDVISSKSLQYADFASQRKFCYSIKREVQTSYRYIRGQQDILYRRVYDDDHIVEATESVPALNILLRTEKETSYVRRIFEPGDIKFQFKPSLSWRRWLDSYALSLRPLTRALRKIL